VIERAIGGDNVTTTVEGRERYPVNVRYMRDFRSDYGPWDGSWCLPRRQKQIPLSQLATIRTVSDPAMIRNEDGLLTGYVYGDIAAGDPNGYMRGSGAPAQGKSEDPPWLCHLLDGQYEGMQRAKERLTVVLPLTLFLILLLLYLNTRSMVKTFIVLLAVPFSAIGAVWFLYALGYNMSIGVWVGLIAVAGGGRRNRGLHAALSRPGL